MDEHEREQGQHEDETNARGGTHKRSGAFDLRRFGSGNGVLGGK